MKFMLTFVRDQDDMYEATDEEMRAAMDAWTAFDQEAVEAGALIACEPLELPKTAKTIELAPSGTATVIDGPFAETKEQLGGFALLECEGPRRGDGVGPQGPDGPRQDRGPQGDGPLTVGLRELDRSARQGEGTGGLEPVAAADHLEHHLVGAGADAVETGVAIGALDLVLLHVAVAAVDLDRVVADLLDDRVRRRAWPG